MKLHRKVWHDRPYFLVMHYSDGSRYPIGILWRDRLYHRTKATQFHHEFDSPSGFDVGTLWFLQDNEIERIIVRYTSERLTRQITVSAVWEATSGVRTMPIENRPETRTRIFPEQALFTTIAFIQEPQPWAAVDEIAIDEEGNVLSVGKDTRKVAVAA